MISVPMNKVVVIAFLVLIDSTVHFPLDAVDLSKPDEEACQKEFSPCYKIIFVNSTNKNKCIHGSLDTLIHLCTRYPCVLLHCQNKSEVVYSTQKPPSVTEQYDEESEEEMEEFDPGSAASTTAHIFLIILSTVSFFVARNLY